MPVLELLFSREKLAWGREGKGGMGWSTRSGRLERADATDLPIFRRGSSEKHMTDEKRRATEFTAVNILVNMIAEHLTEPMSAASRLHFACDALHAARVFQAGHDQALAQLLRLAEPEIAITYNEMVARAAADARLRLKIREEAAS